MDARPASIPQPMMPLYQQEELARTTGGPLRPGGIALTGRLLQRCALAPGSAVLDVGCGPGHSLALMASVFGLKATGIDPSPTMLDEAARNAPAAALLRAEATAIPCGGRSFDAVICECVLSLTGDIAASLEEMHRVLRPGGILILTDIYCKKPGGKSDLQGLQSCISHARPLDVIAGGLGRAGFSPVSFEDRSDALRQLAGQIIFTFGSLEKFWQLFMGAEAARRTCCALATTPLGYYALITQKEEDHG